MRTKIAILLLILILAFGIYEQIYIKDVFGELKSKTEKIYEAINNEDEEAALTLTRETIDWWDEKLKILEIIVPHIALKDIYVQLSSIEGQIVGGDTAQTIGACYILLGLCESTPHLLGFHIQHIF